MSSTYTAGPWKPVSLLRREGEVKARLCIERELLGARGEYFGPEYMRDYTGNVLTFATLEEARAAIAKATGASHEL